MAVDDRADVAGTQAALGNIVGQYHVAVHFEGHVLPRVHGNKSRHVGARVNLPNRAEADVPAAGRLDRPLNLVDDAVRAWWVRVASREGC